MTPVRSSGSTFPVAGCDCSRFAMTSEASASLVVAKRRPGRGSSLRSGPARIQQCKTALCLDGGRVWDAEVSQVQLHIGLYAKSSYRGFLVGPSAMKRIPRLLGSDTLLSLKSLCGCGVPSSHPSPPALSFFLSFCVGRRGYGAYGTLTFRVPFSRECAYGWDREGEL